ncbi:sigma-54-dependent Fis family transcriptional regulator, partial [Neisseria sp. P0009.S007]
HKMGTPWFATDSVEQIVVTPMEMLQMASVGILYVGDIARYSKNIQNGIGFLLEKADRYNVRVIASCGFKRGEGADEVVAG